MNRPTIPIRGLYAVTPDTADTDALLAKTQAVLAGGARIVQYRNKTADAALRRAQATALLALCNRHAAMLLVNDHVALAADIGAHGAHIGGEDGTLAGARNLLGPDRIIGVSCYRELERGRAAAEGGADYIAFGGFYASTVKPGTTRAPLSLLTAARAFNRPVVAIGGITPENAGPLVQAGADAVAVITALYSAPDVGEAARRFCKLFGQVPS
jgi:thiamine-phosphate pyrophosphorylase